MQVLISFCFIGCLCSAHMLLPSTDDIDEDGSGSGERDIVTAYDIISPYLSVTTRSIIPQTSDEPLLPYSSYNDIIMTSSYTSDIKTISQMTSVSLSQSSSLLQTQSSSLLQTQSSSLLQTQSSSLLQTQSSSLLQTQSSSLLQTQSSSLLQIQTTPLLSQSTTLPSLSSSIPTETTPLLSQMTTPLLSQMTTPLLMSSSIPTETTPLLSQLTTPLLSQSSVVLSLRSNTPIPSQTTPSSPLSPPLQSLLSSSTSFMVSSNLSNQLATPTRNSSLLSTVSTSPTPIFGNVPIVTVTVLNASAISVTWTPVFDSTGYNIYIIQNRNSKKRQTDEIVVMISGGRVTSHVISGLKPFTSYSISMASVDSNGMEGIRSVSTPPLITEEAVPSLPRNITWDRHGDDSIVIMWLPPEFPNGIITSYIVVLNFDDGTETRDSVPGNQTMLLVSRPSVTFSVTVLAVNGAGQSLLPVDSLPSDNDGLSVGIITAIVILAVLLVLLIIATAITIIIVWSKRWYKYHGGADINVDELEYRAGDVADFDKEDDVDGQLTAKRWMRANANYSVPSILLPSLSELVSTYKTAEDLVESKTVTRPPPSPIVLQTVGESSIQPLNEQPLSTNSSSERSGDAPSTLSSICSKTHQEINRVVHVETQFTRDSRLVNDDQAVFEMMENIYFASPQEMKSLNQFELKNLSHIDMKEQIGIGNFTKVMRAVLTSTMADLQKGSEVAVKILDADNESIQNRENFMGAAFIISQFSHKNVLSLLGISTTSSPLTAIYTYANLGDLKHFLTRVRRKTRLESQNCNFGLLEQLLISFQIASGMEYLASKFFIHRALQAKYILLNEDYSLKISGFSISHAIAQPDGYCNLKSSGLLPVKWLSMETLVNGKFSSNTDIWSFGVVLWELFAFGLTPFRGVQNDDVLVHLKEGKRLNKPSGCPDNIYTLMLHCWVAIARDRPSFTILHNQLLTYYKDLTRGRGPSDTDESLTRGPSDTDESLTRGPSDTDESLTRGPSDTDESLPSSLPIVTTELTNNNIEKGNTQTINESQEDEPDSMSADNSRVGLLQDYPDDNDSNHVTNSDNNCDLVVSSSNGMSTQHNGNEMELTNNETVYVFEHSLSLRACKNSQESELYTKL